MAFAPKVATKTKIGVATKSVDIFTWFTNNNKISKYGRSKET
jgi:hypothetical protein